MGCVRTLVLLVRHDDAPMPPEWPGLQRVVNEGMDAACEVFGANEVHLWAVDPFIDSLPDRWELDLRYSRASESIIERIAEGGPFDILVAGQTRTVSRAVQGLTALPRENRPRLVIRFSIFYGGTTFGTYAPDVPPSAAGYHLDCPRDYYCLLDLLTDPGLLEAVATPMPAAFHRAAEGFSRLHPEYPDIIVL